MRLDLRPAVFSATCTRVFGVGLALGELFLRVGEAGSRAASRAARRVDAVLAARAPGPARSSRRALDATGRTALRVDGPRAAGELARGAPSVFAVAAATCASAATMVTLASSSAICALLICSFSASELLGRCSVICARAVRPRLACRRSERRLRHRARRGAQRRDDEGAAGGVDIARCSYRDSSALPRWSLLNTSL